MATLNSQPPVESLGPYDLVREIGQGSFSRVYEARDRRSGVLRALKVFSHPCAGDGFVREAGVGFDLRHPNLVTAHDVGYLTGGTRFVAYDFVAGGSLRSRLRLCTLSTAEARHVIVEVARALTTLHRASFVHRDLKPENILLEHGGAFPRIRLGDLGTSEAIRNAPAVGDVGSPAYMAPEQILGSCNTRADTYALGVLAYEMLAGQRPFVGGPAEVMRGHLERAPDLTLLPEVVREAIGAALRKKPEDRVATPYEFAVLFDQALATTAEDGVVDLADAGDGPDVFMAYDVVSGWRVRRWGEQVGIEGSGAPTGYAVLEPEGRAAVSASALVRFVGRDNQSVSVGVGDGAVRWESPLYGCPALVAIRRFAGDAVVGSGGASPGLMVIREDGAVAARVTLPVPLCALVVTSDANGEHLVGVDLQRQHVVVIRAPFEGKPTTVLPAPANLVQLGTRRGRAWLKDADGNMFFPEIPAHGPASLIPSDSIDVATFQHARRLL